MKVLLIGDSPFRKTGFGRVNSYAVEAFLDEGWTVAAITGLDPKPPTDHNVKVYPALHDHDSGSEQIQKVIKQFKPDLIYATADTGSYAHYFGEVLEARTSAPFLGYVPIEGGPIAHQTWQFALREGFVFTCSKYGQKLVKDNLGKKIDYVYHGVDHDVFNVNGRREQIRKSLGWTDKFVLMMVAQNVRRKQHPRLFEALSILKHEKNQNDIVLYDHTVPKMDHWLEGWNLNEISYMYGVFNEVGFNPDMTKGFGSTIGETGDGLTLPDFYNAADLFVLPSQVEGFGLPIAEAMACGLPVLVTKYAAGWEVASPAGAGIPVHDWEVHKSGTRYANVSPRELAKEILRLKRDPRRRERMTAAGLERVKDFQWSDFQRKLIDEAKRTIEEAKQKGPAWKIAEEISTGSQQARQADSGQDKSSSQG